MIRAKLRELDCVPIATGGIENHVHILTSFPPALSISELVKRIKGSSSHFMNEEVLEPGLFQWQGSYGAFSVSDRALSRVKDYVLNQQEHHKSGTVHADWEQTSINESG